MQPEAGWERFTGFEAPTEDEVLLDIRFDSGKELQNLYPWDVKWVGDNPGFGHVEAWRESVRQKRSA